MFSSSIYSEVLLWGYSFNHEMCFSSTDRFPRHSVEKSFLYNKHIASLLRTWHLLTLASLNSGTWIPASPVLLRLQFYIGFEEAFAIKSEVEKEIGSHVLTVKERYKMKMTELFKKSLCWNSSLCIMTTHQAGGDNQKTWRLPSCMWMWNTH